MNEHADRDWTEPPDLLAALQRSLDAARADRAEPPSVVGYIDRDLGDTEQVYASVKDDRAKVARVEALVDQWDGEIGAHEDYQPAAAVRAVEACLRDLRTALAGTADDACTCPWVDPSLWTTYYGAVEPGSTREFDPDCVVHGYVAGRPMPERGAVPALAGPEPEATEGGDDRG